MIGDSWPSKTEGGILTVIRPVTGDEPCGRPPLDIGDILRWVDEDHERSLGVATIAKQSMTAVRHLRRFAHPADAARRTATDGQWVGTYLDGLTNEKQDALADEMFEWMARDRGWQPPEDDPDDDPGTPARPKPTDDNGGGGRGVF